jgi:hypothetical protein
MEQEHGLIAILDALGAANYSGDEINQFLRSRDLVLNLLSRKAKDVRGDIKSNLVKTFIFNDTVLIVYVTESEATGKDVEDFCLLLRKFTVDSLAQGILFRGAISIGRFYVSSQTNTVMGPAVTDAAAWYDRADWMGITATPQATLLIRAMIKQGGIDLAHVVVDYPVPIKDKADRALHSLKAVNWPKGFHVRGVRPLDAGENPKAKFLSLLAANSVPRDTESKYFNTIAFFEHCEGLLRKQQKKKAQRRAAK